MRKIFSIIGTTLATLILSLNLVIAGQVPEFSEVDVNQDGAINTEEAAQVPEISSLFNGADLDQDGKLNSGEYDRAKRHIENKNSEEAE